jgi:hypothetical protein
VEAAGAAMVGFSVSFQLSVGYWGLFVKTREEEEKDNFEVLMKAAGGDPKKLAALVKETLLRDKTIVAPKPKTDDKKDQDMIDAAKNILGKGRRNRI